MSRSALWRQEGNFKDREKRADEVFQEVCDEGRRRNNALPLWGPDDSFHFSPLLLRNTIQSSYFQNCCESFANWNAVIDEIYLKVTNLQPFQTEKSPSTAFCLLLRLLTLRVTAHQMEVTLAHADSPYIRGIGFLYLRYVGTPEELWKWIEPYIHDDNEIKVEQSGRLSTVGEFVRRLFSGRDFCGTPLPRLPILVERDLQVKILQADKAVERAAFHFKNSTRMAYFQTLGNKVMALYGDDENPIQWYEAEVDRIITRDEATGTLLKYPRFVVSFPEYGNVETVVLGELDVRDGEWRNDRLGQPTGRETNNERHLYEEVRRRERDSVTANRNWARKPSTTKASLSHTGHRRSDQEYSTYGQSSERPVETSVQPPTNRVDETSTMPRKRSQEEEASIAEKKRKLASRYG